MKINKMLVSTMCSLGLGVVLTASLATTTSCAKKNPILEKEGLISDVIELGDKMINDPVSPIIYENIKGDFSNKTKHDAAIEMSKMLTPDFFYDAFILSICASVADICGDLSIETTDLGNVEYQLFVEFNYKDNAIKKFEFNCHGFVNTTNELTVSLFNLNDNIPAFNAHSTPTNIMNLTFSDPNIPNSIKQIISYTGFEDIEDTTNVGLNWMSRMTPNLILPAQY
jgi:hypothetical protein